MNFNKGGKAAGIGSDFLIEVMAQAGSPIQVSDIQIVPWARGYDAAQKDKSAMLFSVARTAERENLFQWIGPIRKMQIGLISLKKQNVQIKSAADFSKYKIGTIREGAPEQLLLKAGAPESSLDRGTNMQSNMSKLVAGRIDAFAINILAAQYYAKENGISWDQIDISYTLKEAELYYAVHKSVPADEVKKLNDAVKAAKPKLAAIEAKYLK